MFTTKKTSHLIKKHTNLQPDDLYSPWELRAHHALNRTLTKPHGSLRENRHLSLVRFAWAYAVEGRGWRKRRVNICFPTSRVFHHNAHHRHGGWGEVYNVCAQSRRAGELPPSLAGGCPGSRETISGQSATMVTIAMTPMPHRMNSSCHRESHGFFSCSNSGMTPTRAM